jgi:membrane protease YdiL (CAAX protease family)
MAPLVGLMGIAAAAALAFTGLCRLKGLRPTFLFHTLICLNFVVRLISHYQIWCADPQLQDYCFQLLGTVCATFALMYTGSLLGNGINLLIGWLRGRPVLSGLAEMVDAAPLWQTVVLACILGPIGEEIIFNLLLEKTLVFGEKRAMLFCALTFGLFHGNLYQFFYAFAVRLVLVRLRLRTGSLGLCIGLHVLINLVGGAVAQWMLGQSEQIVAAYGLVLLAMMAAGWTVIANRRAARYAAGRPGTRAQWLFGSAGAVLAWLCCGILFVYSVVMG